MSKDIIIMETGDRRPETGDRRPETGLLSRFASPFTTTQRPH